MSTEEEELTPLIEGLRKGDMEGLKGIYLRFQQEIFRFAYRITGDPHTAWEVTQDTFLDLYEGIKNYREEGKFKSFLFTIAMNRIRKTYRHPPFSPLSPDLKEENPPLEDTIVHQEKLRQVEKALHSLPPKQKSALLLYIEEGLSYKEIADILKVSVDLVKIWIYRAREHLRKEVGE
jgi:RNA polymerase sigma-70 factor (ECF subfamily)